MIKINAIGDVCPIPVIKVKNAMKELNNKGIIEITVDNEIAVQNLSKMANQKIFQIISEKINDKEYKVTINLSKEDVKCELIQDNNINNSVVVISSDKMGDGDEKLGKTLLKSFIFSLTKCDVLPSTIIFYNSGAFLTSTNSESLEDLKTLENLGVEITTCGTCINYYNLPEKPEVGSVSNMYFIAEKLLNSSNVIKP